VPPAFSSPSLSLSFRFRLVATGSAADDLRGTTVRAFVNMSTLSSRGTGIGGPIVPVPIPNPVVPPPVPGSSLYMPIAICGWVSWLATSGGGEGVGE